MNINNSLKPIADNFDLRSKLNESTTRASSFSKAETKSQKAETPENEAKNIMTSFGSKQAFLHLTGKAFSLLQILRELRGSDELSNSYFHAKRPYSSNTNVLQVRSFDLAAMKGFDISNISVDVFQVAQAQRNEGEAMDADARAVDAGFSEGSHHIVMNLGGQDIDIRFNVSATDKVSDVQRKIAEEINNSSFSVRASVSLDEDTGKTSLVVESKETGVDTEGQPNFTFRSIQGNALEVSGIGDITQVAQNALFRVNLSPNSTGMMRSSRTNTVDIGFRITVQLFGVGTSRLTLGRDEQVQSTTMRDMAGFYNDLLSFGKDNEHGDSLAQQLSAIAEDFASALSNIGITFDQDGYMLIDEDILKSATGSGELERFALQDGAGFIDRLIKLLENIGKNPTDSYGVEESLPMYV